MKQVYMIFMIVTAVLAVEPEGRFVTYNTGGKSFEGYYVSRGPQAPLVLVVHDWDGLTDYEVTRSTMLAQLGYSVFAVDLYGKGVRPTETSEKRAQASALYNDRPTMRKRLEAGLLEARKLKANTDNAVAMGYCFGGSAILEFARSGAPLKGFAAFHGGLATPPGQDYSKTKGNIIVFHGTADASVSMDEFALLANELEAQHISHEMIVYSGAPHAFTIFGSDRYREDADRKSWARFKDYLVETLGQP